MPCLKGGCPRTPPCTDEMARRTPHACDYHPDYHLDRRRRIPFHLRVNRRYSTPFHLNCPRRTPFLTSRFLVFKHIRNAAFVYARSPYHFLTCLAPRTVSHQYSRHSHPSKHPRSNQAPSTAHRPIKFDTVTSYEPVITSLNVSTSM